MAPMSDAEMEQFQKLSDTWQPGIDGQILIGPKQPMDVLINEYAAADASYVAKTSGLAATHSSYRAVKGDGQCGWRSTAFAYFEILLTSGDPSFVQIEKLRFESFADSMRMLGLDYEMLADLFTPTFELFDKIQNAVNNGINDIQIVTDDLNNEHVSNYIVYHFKMITGTHMQLRADQYEPFLEMTVEEYRIKRIDPTVQEIDQIGLQALTDAVISAANINLEVLYLDRSIGDEVTPHQFSSLPNAGHLIQLLYRPGHYDIIYKSNQPMTVMLAPQAIPQQMENLHPTQTNSMLESLYGQSNSGTTSLPVFSYEPRWHGEHTQQGYPHHQHYLMDQSFYTQPTYTTMPQQMPAPPTTIPMHITPQPSRPAPSRKSNSSRSETMSPSPSSAPAPPSEPQIRFTSSMYNMHKHEGIPFTQSA